MRTLSKKQKIGATIAAAGVLAVAGGGIAFAYWSSTGSGTGTATTTTGESNIAIAQTSVIGDLAPGVSPDTISGTVTNNAVNKAYVNTVTVSISGVTKASGAPAGTCDSTDYTLSNPAMTVATDLAANGGSANFTGATLAFNDKATNQDACKGATVSLAYVSN